MRVYAIVNGVEHSLNDDSDLARFYGEDGLGMAPLHRLSDRGPLQHGDTDRGFRLDPRQVSYVFHLVGSTPAELWQRRMQLMQVFAPGSLITMRHVLPDGSERRLDGYYAGGLSMGANDRLGRYQRVAVILRAPDPTLYDLSAGALSFIPDTGVGAYVIPLTVPFTIGGSGFDQAVTLGYPGTWRAYPDRILITGPVRDARIVNETTGEVLDFTGVTINNGDWIEIDLRYGRKTVIDQDGANRIGSLTTGSDLQTWHIAAADEVPGGDNSIRVSGEDVTGITRVDISYLVRYTGV